MWLYDVVYYCCNLLVCMFSTQLYQVNDSGDGSVCVSSGGEDADSDLFLQYVFGVLGRGFFASSQGSEADFSGAGRLVRGLLSHIVDGAVAPKDSLVGSVVSKGRVGRNLCPRAASQRRASTSLSDATVSLLPTLNLFPYLSLGRLHYHVNACTSYKIPLNPPYFTRPSHTAAIANIPTMAMRSVLRLFGMSLFAGGSMADTSFLQLLQDAEPVLPLSVAEVSASDPAGSRPLSAPVSVPVDAQFVAVHALSERAREILLLLLHNHNHNNRCNNCFTVCFGCFDVSPLQVCTGVYSGPGLELRCPVVGTPSDSAFAYCSTTPCPTSQVSHSAAFS